MYIHRATYVSRGNNRYFNSGLDFRFTILENLNGPVLYLRIAFCLFII
jgi:hypothetical protein